MSRKSEARQRAVEEQILQYKAVVEYLSVKSDVAAIPHRNQVCIEQVLMKGNWTRLNGSWCKDGLALDLIQAGIKEFQVQYDRLRADHLLKTVKSLKEG